jgi:hypothetical protein
MKFLFYSDLQIDRSNTMYAEFVQSTLTHLASVVQERKPDYLINLGDVLDGFGHVTVQDLTYTYDWMEYLGDLMQGRGLPSPRHWILKGNHDIGDKEGLHSTVHVLSCDMMNEVHKELNTPEIEGFGHVLVIPYTNNYASVRAELEKMRGLPVKAIFAHTDWIGIRPSIKSGHISTDGLDAGRFADLFPDVPIFTGHYHTPMAIGNLNVVGSPLYKDFSDVLTDLPRGFLLWDTEAKEIERIENPSTYYCAEVRAEDSQSLRAQCDVLLPNKDRLKVKVYAPNSLMREADALFEPFLWHTTYSAESLRTGVEHAADVTVHTSPAELVEMGMLEASPDYDATLLREYGREAFR